MDGWEYCEVDLFAEGRLLGAKKWSAQVIYYTSNGGHRTEKLGSDFSYDQDHPEYARDAMGQMLAQMGERGWELVRYQGSRESQVRDALLKRRLMRGT